MGQPYIGEIRLFGGNFAPNGWARCNGQLLPISSYDALFVLIGTTYGGDGETTFALPNLQSRVPVHYVPTTLPLGEMGGVESVTLTTQQIPNHTHAVLASEGTADQVVAAGNVPAEASKRFYLSPGTPASMAPQALGPAGGSQPHGNMQPFLVVNFIIALFGVFPSQT